MFLDEPTAGVDVALRRDMWDVVRDLRASGVTIILTTHYIEEAEDMADRIGVISSGKILEVEDKTTLMQRLGKKTLVMTLAEPLQAIPDAVKDYALTLCADGKTLTYTYDTSEERTGITRMISDLAAAHVSVHDLESHKSSLEDVFLDLLEEQA